MEVRKEGRNRFARVHEKTVESASHSLIGYSWAAAGARLRQGYAGQAVPPLRAGIRKLHKIAGMGDLIIPK